MAFRCRGDLVSSEQDTLIHGWRRRSAGRKFVVTIAFVAAIIGGVSIVRPTSVIPSASFADA